MEIWGKEILTDVETVLQELNRQSGGNILRVLKISGNNIMTQCLFHGDGNEHKPSMGISINPTKRDKKLFESGTVHCFTCGYNADLPNFISDLMNKKDGGKAGYKWLIDNFVTLVMDEKKPIRLNIGNEETKPITYITEEELDKYRYTHPYMYQRGLTDDIINFFDIGFDKDTNCITFPVWDRYAKGVLFIQRRSVKSKFFHFEKDLPKGETLYGIEAVLKYLDKIDSLIICESPIDALTAWKYGKPAVALMGCLITQQQVEILKELPIRNYFLALDNDDAGRMGRLRIRNMLKGKMLYDVKIPQYAKDLNDIKECDWVDIGKIKLFNL